MGQEIDLMVNYPRPLRKVDDRGQRKTPEDQNIARRFGKEEVIKWKSKEDNVFASLANGESSQILATKRELYEDYVMYCKDISKTHRGS